MSLAHRFSKAVMNRRYPLEKIDAMAREFVDTLGALDKEVSDDFIGINSRGEYGAFTIEYKKGTDRCQGRSTVDYAHISVRHQGTIVYVYEKKGHFSETRAHEKHHDWQENLEMLLQDMKATVGVRPYNGIIKMTIPPKTQNIRLLPGDQSPA